MAEFRPPVRLSAGFFHNLVLAYPVATADHDEAMPLPVKMEEKPEGTSVYAFGSNRHNCCSLGQKSIYAREKQKEDKDGFFGEPEHLYFFRGRFISEVACGGNHSMLLEKRFDQDGGALWTMGLGTAGRLGIQRPTSVEEMRKLYEFSGYREDHIAELLNDPRMVEEMTDFARFPSWSSHDPFRVAFPNNEKIAQVACGIDHTICVTEHGMIFSWGVGNYGNLGTGETIDVHLPEHIRMPEDVPCKTVAAGTKHSLAIDKFGLMFAWGHGGNGRLGLGDRMRAALSPEKINGHDEHGEITMTVIAAGEAHSASIDSLGQVYCWGAGSYGRTGHGEDTDCPIPRVVSSLGGRPCHRVALGMVHSLALTVEGRLYSWGAGLATGLIPIGDASIRNTPMEIHENAKQLYEKPLVQVTAGPFHSLAMNSIGQIFSWGMASESRLGQGRNNNNMPWPTQLKNSDTKFAYKLWDCKESAVLELGRKPQEKQETKAFQPFPDDADATKLMAVACGGMHSAGLSETGELYMWGSCEYGQQGFGNPLADIFKPKLLAIPNQKIRIRSICLGLEHTLALTEHNRVLAWGRGENGQLGTGKAKDESSPVELSSLANVYGIAAGEDHSAAVIMHSGDLYTWGSAECGKLGHGSSMTTGSQNLPRQVRMTDRLVYVECGGQHTAVLNSQSQLFTFGAGWFGRLGHGADQANMYDPAKVPEFAYDDEDPPEDTCPAPKVKAVSCASYHTCIVCENDNLWVCGRDRQCCQGDHVKVPLFFGMLTDGPKGEVSKVKQVVAYAQHTMVLTQYGDLWVWGDNKKGQLGMDIKTKPRVVVPEVLRCSRWGVKTKVVMVVTGIAHSMCLLSSGEVLTWGLKTSGRLGLEDPIEGRNTDEPKEVYQTWNLAAVGDDDEAPGSDSDEDDKEGGTQDGQVKADVSPFTILQKELRTEEEEKKEPQLRAQEENLKIDYTRFIQHIFSLWDEPKPGTEERPWRPSELTLREAEAKLDQSLCRNLKLLDLADMSPSLDDLKIHPEVCLRLHLYQELVWVLQQQPSYFARALQRFELDKQKTMADVFMRVIKNVYAELHDQRTRNLHMSLIRLVMMKELNDSKLKLDTIFDPNNSKVVRLIENMMCHPYFGPMHSFLFDAEGEKGQFSLLARIEHWSYWRVEDLPADDKGKREDPRGKQHDSEAADSDMIESIFALDEDSLQYHDQPPPEGEGPAQYYRNRFAQHMAVFQHFLNEDFSKKFFPKYVKMCHGAPHPKSYPDDIKCALWKAWDTIQDLPYAQAYKDEEYFAGVEGDPDRPAKFPKIFEPILKLFVTCCLANLMKKHESMMTYSMRAKMEARWRKRVQKMNPQWQSEVLSPVERKKFEAKVDFLINRTHWNMCMFGEFLWMAATNGFKQSQGMAKERATKLLRVMFVPIMDMVLKSENGDDTETKLTIDLYMSHYDMTRHYVTIWTFDLLRLSNILFDMKNEDDDPEIRRDSRLRLTDLAKDDRVCQLLDQIQPLEEDPRDPTKKNQQGKVVKWSEFYLKTGEAHNVPHNFKVLHRFLEFHRDLCFCRESQAPIPRSLAIQSQRGVSELRTLKPYKAVPGPSMDGKFPFQDLEVLFSMRELPIIKSFDFQAMKYEFEEIQKNINVRNAEKKDVGEFELVSKIEAAKRNLDKMRQHLLHEEQASDFIEEAIEHRGKHFSYLGQVQNGAKFIREAREEYDEALDKAVAIVQACLEASETSTMALCMKMQAQNVGIKLKFAPMEKMKKAKKRREEDSGKEPGLVTYPSATFKLAWLRDRKIVARLDPKVPEKSFRNIRFDFAYMESGNWTVEVQHHDKGKVRTLRKFPITVKEIDIMRGAGKTAKMPFDDGFCYINCFALLQHLARISAGSY